MRKPDGLKLWPEKLEELAEVLWTIFVGDMECGASDTDEWLPAKDVCWLLDPAVLREPESLKLWPEKLEEPRTSFADDVECNAVDTDECLSAKDICWLLDPVVLREPDSLKFWPEKLEQPVEVLRITLVELVEVLRYRLFDDVECVACGTDEWLLDKDDCWLLDLAVLREPESLTLWPEKPEQLVEVLRITLVADVECGACDTDERLSAKDVCW